MRSCETEGCKSGVGVGGGPEGLLCLTLVGAGTGGWRGDGGDAGSQPATNHKGILGDALSEAALSLQKKKKRRKVN